MRYEFYIVDESGLVPALLQQAVAQGPEAVLACVRAHGGCWGEARASAADFAQVFSKLDDLTGGQPFLIDLAFAGSPSLVLTGLPGSWQLGYFEASLVQHLQPVFKRWNSRIENAVASISDGAEAVYMRFSQTLDEAFVREGAVAIFHG